MGAPGQVKTGGRKKGTPNQETRSLETKCQEAGIDFFGELIKVAQNPEHPDHFAAVKEGCQYLNPKRKAIEIAADKEANEMVFRLEDYMMTGERAEKLLALSDHELVKEMRKYLNENVSRRENKSKV